MLFLGNFVTHIHKSFGLYSVCELVDWVYISINSFKIAFISMVKWNDIDIIMSVIYEWYSCKLWMNVYNCIFEWKKLLDNKVIIIWYM